jgi:ribosomal protein S18 acetylase RimI-like enzyme
VLIDNLAVSPACQGLGIGSHLLAVAEDAARSAGLDEVRLFTHQLMVENLRYYARRGYVETHRLQENGFSRVFFTKRLT